MFIVSKKIKVESCMDCPYCESHFAYQNYICEKNEKLVIKQGSVFNIHPDCPLNEGNISI